MQIQTDEMRRAIGEATDVVPRRPGLMDAWLCVLDAVVQVLTFGRSGSGAFFAGRRSLTPEESLRPLWGPPKIFLSRCLQGVGAFSG